MNLRTALPLTVFSLAGTCLAQQEILVPKADQAGSTELVKPSLLPVVYPQRLQQIVDRGMAGGKPRLIHGISLKVAPQFTSGTVAWDIRLSHTGSSVMKMSSTFGDNLNEKPVLAFSGKVALKAKPQQRVWANVTFGTPFSFDPKKGDLLIDILDHDDPNYALEFTAARPLTVAKARGVGGPLPKARTTFVMTRAGLVLDASRNALTFVADATGAQQQNPASFIVGPVGATPVELTAVGAPGNTLYVNPVMILPQTSMSRPCGLFHNTLIRRLPQAAALKGLSISVQAVMDRPANSLGLVFSDVMDVTFSNPDATVGRLLYGPYLRRTGSFASPCFGSLTMKLTTFEEGPK